MKTILALAACCITVLSGAEADEASLNPHLEPLRPLLGKTWKGIFTNSKPDQPTVDISRWDRILNGQGVRLLHSINQGLYGGESIFIWDEEKQTAAYYYFTAAGFRTTGSLEGKDGKIVTHETVIGGAGAITEVRGSSEIRSDGRFHVKTEHLKNGQWTPGHEATYEGAPSAQVLFR